MIRAVLDTVIFVRALLNPRSVWGRIIFSSGHRFQWVVSRPILDEILDVLARPALVNRFKLRHDQYESAIETVRSLLDRAEVVQLGSIDRYSRDTNDDKFVATAIAGAADYLVTEDQDLLVLKRVGEIAVVDGPTFARLLIAEPA